MLDGGFAPAQHAILHELRAEPSSAFLPALYSIISQQRVTFLTKKVCFYPSLC
jgi:hypothetical protein